MLKLCAYVRKAEQTVPTNSGTAQGQSGKTGQNGAASQKGVCLSNIYSHTAPLTPLPRPKLTWEQTKNFKLSTFIRHCNVKKKFVNKEAVSLN